MKRLLSILLGVALLTLGPPVVVLAAPTITIYADNQPGWENAVVIWQTEDFSDATLNPGLSVVSDNGLVDTVKGVWWDRLIEPAGTTTTTWIFADPIYAFGGNWDLAGPGGPGSAIAVLINGSWVSVDTIPNTYTGEFWGFVSDEEFTQVLLQSGGNPIGWAETYELDNMVYAVNQPPLPPAVGGDVFPVNKMALTAPWIAIGMAIIAGSLIVMRRRRAGT